MGFKTVEFEKVDAYNRACKSFLEFEHIWSDSAQEGSRDADIEILKTTFVSTTRDSTRYCVLAPDSIYASNSLESPFTTKRKRSNWWKYWALARKDIAKETFADS